MLNRRKEFSDVADEKTARNAEYCQVCLADAMLGSVFLWILILGARFLLFCSVIRGFNSMRAMHPLHLVLDVTEVTPRLSECIARKQRFHKCLLCVVPQSPLLCRSRVLIAHSFLQNLTQMAHVQVACPACTFINDLPADSQPFQCEVCLTQWPNPAAAAAPAAQQHGMTRRDQSFGDAVVDFLCPVDPSLCCLSLFHCLASYPVEGQSRVLAGTHN